MLRIRPLRIAGLALLAASPLPAQFQDATRALGLGNEFYAAATGLGLGIAAPDVNNDGRVDLFVTNGFGLSPHLYLNLGPNLGFQLSDSLLPPLPSVEMSGVVFADYDNDGDVDLYITTDNEFADLNGVNPADGPANLLLHNELMENGGVILPGQPLFSERAAAAGVDDLAASPLGAYPGLRATSAAWLDYDRDGWVDLFVGHAVLNASGDAANANRLYRNNGDGTFSDVTALAGINDGSNTLLNRPTMAVVAADFTGDLWPDLYVVNANDDTPYYQDVYYINNGDGTFSAAPNAGNWASHSGWGRGIAAGDPDRDGDLDLYIADRFTTPNSPTPGNVLLANIGGSFRGDWASRLNVSGEDSWGTAFVDLNYDTWEDLVAATETGSGVLVFGNLSGRSFGDFTQIAGMGEPGEYRGLAIADLDGDGDEDIVAVRHNDTLRAFLNEVPSFFPTLRIRLEGTRSNRSGIGARVSITTDLGTFGTQVLGGSSSHSQDSLEVVMPAASASNSRVDLVRVDWPSGQVSQMRYVPPGGIVPFKEDDLEEYGFEDVTGQAGVADEMHNKWGACWADYDGDGDLDLYVVNTDENTLFEQVAPGQFVDVTAQTGAGDPYIAMRNVFADYDRDGDLDFYSHNFVQSTLYQNNNNVYTDVNAQSGAGLQMPNGTGMSWVDFDNDGWLDIHAVGFNDPGTDWNVLLRNNGDGTFSDAQPGSGIPYNGESMGQHWVDWNNDGWQDFAQAAVRKHNDDFLYVNNGNGTFTDVTVSSGMLAQIEDGSSGAAAAWGDYDNDGWLDLCLTEVTVGSVKTLPNRFYIFHNNGDGTFTEVSEELGMWPLPTEQYVDFWEAGWADWNNDGWLDLAIGCVGPNLFFLNNGDGTFTDIAAEIGANNLAEGKAIIFGDYDEDGDLDFYLANRANLPPDMIGGQLFRNKGGSNHWLQIELKATVSNLDSIGARAWVTAGGMTRMAEISGGRGLFSQDSPILQFGLGSSTVADTVEVRWPSGRTLTLTNVAADQRLTLVEP